MKGFQFRAGAILALAFLIPACGIGGDGTLNPAVAPGIPAGVSAAAGNRSVTVSWSSASVTAEYRVKRSVTSGGPYFPVSVPGQFSSSTSYVDPDLANGTDYYYVVSARNAFGESADSAEVQGTPGFTPLAVVSGSAANHSLAILPDRTVWAWGGNNYGQLGNGSTTGQTGAPVQVRGLTDATAVAAGLRHSLALRVDGSVWAWGYDSDGQLGQGFVTNGSVPLPVQVPGLSGVVALSAGYDHSVVLKNDGTVWSCGANWQGQLGDGTSSAFPVPTVTQAVGLTDIIAVSAGAYFTLALRQDGTVWVWGSNDHAQFGDGSSGGSTANPFPTQVPNLTGITAVSAGLTHCFALRVDGTLWTWGRNQYGQMGTGSTLPALVTRPNQVPNIADGIAIAAGQDFNCVLRSGGAVWSWGNITPGNGTNGSPPLSPVLSPVQATGLGPVKAIAAGTFHTLALQGDGTLRSWGFNDVGQIGNDTGAIHSIPTTILNLTAVTALSTSKGYGHTLALRSDGTIRGWGGNQRGQLALPASATLVINPVAIAGLSGMTAVAAGHNHSLALKSDGTVWGWGDNSSGELGTGSASATPVTTPAQAINLTGVSAIAAGGTLAVNNVGFSLALKSDGTVRAWGDNSLSQLGLGNKNNANSPQVVPGLGGIVAIAAGCGHSLALQDDQTVWAWGNNDCGQVGNGIASATAVANPYKIPGLTGIVAIAAGGLYSLALDNTGVVWAWGDDSFGQMDGIPNSPPRTIPAPYPGLSGVASIAAGYGHATVLRTDGTVWSWGFNSSGQTGSGQETTFSGLVQAINLEGVTAVFAGLEHGDALFPDGSVRAWGSNIRGQLARPYLGVYATPTSITQ